MFFFARTKVDADLRYQREDFPDTCNEKDSLKKISRNIEDNLKACGLNVPVYLISCIRTLSEWNDFPRLRLQLLEDFPQFKRSAMVYAIAPTGREIIRAKYDLLLEEKTYYWPVLPALVESLPIPGVNVLVEISQLEKIITYCLNQFGIDQISLERLSRQFEIPLSTLLQELQTQCGDVTPRNIALEALEFRGGNRTEAIILQVVLEVFKTATFLFGGSLLVGACSYNYMYGLIKEVVQNLKKAALNIQDLVWKKKQRNTVTP